MRFTDEQYAELGKIFASGDITNASKADLEQYAVMLCRPMANIHFAGQQFPQICETVRLLLTVQNSQESNREAKRISVIALIISVLALCAGVVQAAAALWPFMK